MRERAQHPADRIAQFLIGLAESRENFFPDPQIVGIIRSRDPEAQNIGAESSMTVCGAVTLPTDFDIFRPFSSKTKPWVRTAS